MSATGRLLHRAKKPPAAVYPCTSTRYACKSCRDILPRALLSTIFYTFYQLLHICRRIPTQLQSLHISLYSMRRHAFFHKFFNGIQLYQTGNPHQCP